MEHIQGRRKRQREQPGSSNITILWGGGGFNKTIIPLGLVGYESYSYLGVTRLIGHLPSHIQQARVEYC